MEKSILVEDSLESFFRSILNRTKMIAEYTPVCSSKLLSFEQAVNNIICVDEPSREIPHFNVFPCSVPVETKTIQSGKRTSLMFALTCIMQDSNGIDDSIISYLNCILHEDISVMRSSVRGDLDWNPPKFLSFQPTIVTPAQGFDYAGPAWDILKDDLWLGRVARLYDKGRNKEYTLVIMGLEQLLLYEHNETNIWLTPPFSSVCKDAFQVLYFLDQQRKNCYKAQFVEDCPNDYADSVLDSAMFRL